MTKNTNLFRDEDVLNFMIFIYFKSFLENFLQTRRLTSSLNLGYLNLIKFSEKSKKIATEMWPP